MASRAFADMVDVTVATCPDLDGVVHRWMRQADMQSRLDIGGRPGVDIEVRIIRDRLATEVDR